MTEQIRVTIDGEPVAREVTLDQVREYLRAKGWGERDTPPERLGLTPDVSVTLWKCPGHAGPLDPSVSIIWPLSGQTDEDVVRTAIYNIGRHEGRHHAAVLREIAGEPSAETVRAVADGHERLAVAAAGAMDRMRTELAEACADASRMREREALFFGTLEKLGPIADGGQYRNDVAARIERIGRVAEAWKAYALALSDFADTKRTWTEAQEFGVRNQPAIDAAARDVTDALAKLRSLGIDPDAPEGT